MYVQFQLMVYTIQKQISQNKISFLLKTNRHWTKPEKKHSFDISSA